MTTTTTTSYIQKFSQCQRAHASYKLLNVIKIPIIVGFRSFKMRESLWEDSESKDWAVNFEKFGNKHEVNLA